jgi:hypothetical protein
MTTQTSEMEALTQLANELLTSMKLQPTAFKDLSKEHGRDKVTEAVAFTLLQDQAAALTDAAKILRGAKSRLTSVHALTVLAHGPGIRLDERIDVIKAVDMALTDAHNALIEIDRTMVNDIASMS